MADPVHCDTSAPAINAAGRFIMCLEPEGQSESGLGYPLQLCCERNRTIRKTSKIDQKKELRNETARGSTAGFGGTGVLMRCEFTDQRYPKRSAVSASAPTAGVSERVAVGSRGGGPSA